MLDTFQTLAEYRTVILSALIGIIALGTYSRFSGTGAGKTKRFNKRIFKNYQAQPSLFVGKHESIFFKVLASKFGSKYHVMAKVRLEDIISVKKSVRNKDEWALRGRIKSRHVDFLLVNNSGKPVLAIELDDATHLMKAAKRSDKFKDMLFESTGIPLGRVVVGKSYNDELSLLAERYQL